MIKRNTKSLLYHFDEYLVLAKYNDKVTYQHCMFIACSFTCICNFHVFYTLRIGVLNIILWLQHIFPCMAKYWVQKAPHKYPQLIGCAKRKTKDSRNFFICAVNPNWYLMSVTSLTFYRFLCFISTLWCFIQRWLVWRRNLLKNCEH